MLEAQTAICRECGRVLHYAGTGVIGGHAPGEEKLRWRRVLDAKSRRGIIANLCPGSFLRPKALKRFAIP